MCFAAEALKENQLETHKYSTESRQNWQLHLDLKHEIIIKAKYGEQEQSVKIERKDRNEVEAP